MEKREIDIFVAAFWTLIVFAIYSIIAVFKLEPYNFRVDNFSYPVEPIVVNMELKDKYSEDTIFLCFNDNCKTLATDFYNNIYYYKFDKNDNDFLHSKVKNVYFLYPPEFDKFEDNIINMDIHVGTKGYYYRTDEIKKFEKFQTELQLDNSDKTQKYNVLKLPIKQNYKGIITHGVIYFLSLFYNWSYFIIPYAWLFIAFIIYIFNKDKFNFKWNEKLVYPILAGIVIIGALIRFVDISYIPLWTDEVYTRAVALQSLKDCFKDPGNPPLFFFMEYIFSSIFGMSRLALRFLPCIFGCLLPLMVFIMFKDINKKEALFISFLAAVNLISIHHSQEARGYTLCMLLSICGVYLLFKYLKNPDNRNLILYTLVLILTFNTNYYLILFAFTNFIWGVGSLFINKNNNQIFKFVLANFIAGLTFIPYYLISSSQALSEGFNGWIDPISSATFLYIIRFYFSNKYVFLILCIVLLLNLILCFTKLKFIDQNKKQLLIYLIYTMIFILLLASGISVFLKPILHKRVLLSLYGLLFMIESLTIVSVIKLDKFNKYISIIKGLYVTILTVVYFSIISPILTKEVCNVYDFMNFVKNDSVRYKDDYKIYAITCDTIDYLNAYPETKKLDYINWEFINTNSGKVLNLGRNFRKHQYAKNGEKVVLYLNPIGVDVNDFGIITTRAIIYRSNLTPSVKVVYGD